jgi:plastocyanin
VSGSNQQGKAGEWLDQPLVVRVTNVPSVGISDVEVQWRVTSGDGAFDFDRGNPVSVISSRTDRDGFAQVAFRPSVFGQSAVAASVVGVQGSQVSFTIDATAVVISNYWALHGPDGSRDVTVPVGATVEWVNSRIRATIRSTSTPPGGSSFESGELSQSDRFQFVPTVVGTWEYVMRLDETHAEAGTITAR